MTTLPSTAAEDVFPLSFAQERIWFLDQLDPGSAAFTITAALRVRGRLDAAALDRALTALTDRHEVLRTRFDHDGKAPVQLVAPAKPPVLRLVDLGGLPVERARAAAEAVAARQARSSFDLREGPLLRAGLVRIADAEGLLLLVLHHTACDGWSADLLVRDLAELYRAEVRGTAPELPELPIQYADFAVWQRETPAELDEQLAYWTEALSGVPRVLDLPADHPRPAEQDFGGAMVSRELGPDLAAALVDAARAEGATPFMLLLAAYQAVLARRSGQPAFLVGTPVSGRTRPETADLLGCFINMLALPADVAGDPTARELLARVRRTCLAGYAHQDLPFEHLVTELDPPRDLGRAPLAQVLLAVQDGLSGEVDVDGATLVPAPVSGGVASYDLTLDAQLAPEGFRLNLVYATALFEAVTAEGILEDVVAVLTAMGRNLGMRLSELPIGAGLAEAGVPAVEARRMAAEVLGIASPGPVEVTGEQAGPVAICVRDDARRAAARRAACGRGALFLELDPTAPPAYLARRLGPATVLVTDRADLADLPVRVITPPDDGPPGPGRPGENRPGRDALVPAQLSHGLVFPLRALTGTTPAAGITDFTGCPALPGARGELWLGGSAEPLHHVDGPARTAELLAPAPGGTRRLRTGRTARLAGGHVELLGPPDPAELEAVLRAHPDVTAAAVVTTAAGETVAVHVPAVVSALDTYLAAELPARLRPDRCLGLPGLPDTPEALLAVTAQRTSGYEGAARPRTHLERAILDCFGTALDRRDIGIHDDFFDAGGTSLTAARLIVALPEAVGMPVPLKTLFTNSTVAALAAALEDPEGPGAPDSAMATALQDEQLPAGIAPTGPPRPAPPDGRLGRVLLTGGTGFLGGHMIAELLRHGATEVVCLVRGEDPAGRLAANLAGYDQDDVDPAKLTVLPGDLTLPRFGLDEAGFVALADRLDVIYHCAAHMNFILPYRVLRAPNVVGTTELLRLACTARPTPVHYVSTIDMRVGDVLPERPGPLEAGTSDGYVLSKKTGEHLVLEAGRRGLPVGVYRPWLITGATGTGAVGVRDQLALCLAGSLIAGLMPEDTPIPLHVLPVDLVSAAIVRLSRLAPRPNPVHQFYNPQVAPMESIHEHLTRTGYRFDTVPYAQWRVQLARRTAGRLDGLAALLSIDGPMTGDPDVVEIGNTLSGLGGDAGFPDMDVDYVAKTVAFLVRQGMVPELTASGVR
ncbi:thioester reductase domain-containing protein [Amycolatopsis sp. CA-128772]|uniref:thioester reductase domain-containing protein n=1 Tax=Amycolatopsis sp. CA-128772 TaxID=2073159 RepID=UPI000CD1955E|nr:thioester reductase domain-containing protein [Amycolatopsis sp. CA-128772]